MAIDVEQVEETLEERINDTNNIATCKWLSQTLNLNINDAKRALNTFVKHQRSKGGKDVINVTYFIAGLGKSKSGELEHKCVVAPESDLEVVKKSLSIVTSCHIYSIQKSKLKDYIPLYSTDYDIIRSNINTCASNSSIKCSWVSLRKLKPESSGLEKVQPVRHEEPAPAPPSGGNIKPAAKSAPPTKANPKGSIASMFTMAGKKGTGNSGKSTPAAAAPPKANEATETSSKVKPHLKKGVLDFFHSGNKKPVANGKSSSLVKQEEKTQEKQKQSKKGRSSGDFDDEPDRKRRKRIRTDLFDSSEEDEDPVEEEEEARLEEEAIEIEESPVPVEAKDQEVSGSDDGDAQSDEEKQEVQGRSAAPTEPVNGEGRKRRRRKKVVPKQYIDEEGFMVTKQETVWESEDDSVEELEVEVAEDKKTSKPSSVAAVKGDGKRQVSQQTTEQKRKATMKKTTASPQKGKQMLLMSFFKKN